MSITKTIDQAESVTLRLRTPESTADAAVVASMLHALVVLIEETNRGIGDQREIAIRVRPFEEGSLEIPFDLIVYGGVGLLAINTAASQILKTIQQAVDLKKSLQGKPPEKLATDASSQSPLILNSGNNVVINLVQNPHVTAALHQAFVDVEKDQAIEGVQIVDNTTSEELVNISRPEFPYFRYPEADENEPLPDERVRGEQTTLIIHSPVLAGKAKWKFIYEGATISASMADESFLGRVRGRAEQFAAGDRLQVLLEIGEKYDDSTSAYRRTGQYVVRQVLKHSPPPPKRKEKDLFDE